MFNWLKQAALLFVLCCCCRAQDVPAPTQGNLAGEQLRLSEILIATQQPDNSPQATEAERKAEKLLSEIKNGSDFAELAKSNSNGPSATLGGDVG
jgi:parvulin-like peptidyl-prolyl isomerase